MTVIVKKPGFNVPEAIAKKAGIKPGDFVEFIARRGRITITTTHPGTSANSPINAEKFPLYTPTKAEARAIAKGLAEYRRGDYITLNQLHNELDAARHKVSKKSTRRAS
jgi:bifunctional DNA-binding transcriptional regulator/antitoxin component of YhaV-PrlF toxin-antitoxin module